MQYRKKINSQKGFTLIEIMIVIMIISLLVAISIPSVMKARSNSQEKCCLKNLRQIQDAKTQMAMENSIGGDIDLSLEDLKSYIKETPFCPAGGTYAPNSADTAPTCTVDGHEILF